MNVINLEDYKGSKELKRSEELYGRYLKTLGNTQLEYEINALLEEFSGETYGKDSFAKGRLILNEISSRASQSVRSKIEHFSKDTLKLI
jgi:hypothetical protein